MKCVLGGNCFYSELLHMNKQHRGSVYSTSAETVDMFLCITVQDAGFVDVLVEMKVFLSRGNKRCGEVWCLRDLRGGRVWTTSVGIKWAFSRQRCLLKA